MVDAVYNSAVHACARCASVIHRGKDSLPTAAKVRVNPAAAKEEPFWPKLQQNKAKGCDTNETNVVLETKIPFALRKRKFRMDERPCPRCCCYLSDLHDKIRAWVRVRPCKIGGERLGWGWVSGGAPGTYQKARTHLAEGIR